MADPTQLEVIRNALESIADEMAITLYRTARSSGVRLGWDFSTAILTQTGDLVGQGMCHPIHLGGMMPALKGCLNHFDDRIAPEDVLITNDPYEGAQHLPDIYLFKPVYYASDLVAYVGAICHHTDIGGRVPGGQGFDNREIYQEGLRIPPLLLYRQGEPNETLFRLLEKAVRNPQHVLGDLRAQKTSLEVGERQVRRLVGRYGVDCYHELAGALIAYTEKLTRDAIAVLPDGAWRFTDYVDDDGIDDRPIEIVATVRKQGTSIEVDFSGTSPQCAGSITGLKHMNDSYVHMALRSLLGPDLPSTAGFFRPISVTAPAGSFVNPLPPAAVGARQVGGRRINHAVWGALAQMAPERAFACPGGADAGLAISGIDKSQSPWRSWVLTEGFNETACGGRPDKDGMEGQGSNVTNQANTPVEILEREHLVRIVEYGFTPDSEGPGRYRGGLALARRYEFLEDGIQVRVRSDRWKRPPWGVAGGGRAPPPVVDYFDGDEVSSRPGKSMLTVRKNDQLYTQWCGGGGYGDPLSREPEAVLRDVVEEKTSPRHAADVYGVVIDERKRKIDIAATTRRRARCAEQNRQKDNAP